MATNNPNVQHIRFRRPIDRKTGIEEGQESMAPRSKLRRQGLLQELLRRTAKGPFAPSLSLAFRLLVLVRVSAAMYSNIQDCDEVFNFWEPLHYLDRNVGFQTWEVSPQYAIRSWAYIIFHLLPAWGPVRLVSLDKRAAFFAVRIFLAVISSFCEAKFYRTIVEVFNERIGRYTLIMLMFSTGMWNASTAFLPSSFAMYANLLAFSYAFQLPAKSNPQRTLLATFFFATGAIVGWPFSLLVSVPFVIEEIFVRGADLVSTDIGVYAQWVLGRVKRLFGAGIIAASLFVPIIAIDSLGYGRFTVVPWNIIKYNIFGGSERGPELYGTEPPTFYFLNLLLNFNIILPLALASAPFLLVTSYVDRKRVGLPTGVVPIASPPTSITPPGYSSPWVLIVMRLAPLYLWIIVLTAQPHKEERFMSPIYPLVCLNAAISVYLVRGWFEKAYVNITKSPYRASRSPLFQTMTRSVMLTFILISISRILAFNHYYHAPLDVVYHLESEELPRLLNVTGLLRSIQTSDPSDVDDDHPLPVDLGPVKEFGLRLCYGKEWYRFPSHYLVPDGIDVQFIKSEFNGLLPRHFEHSKGHEKGIWRRDATRIVPRGLNDLNKEEQGQYVDVSTCDYLIDLDFPHHPPNPPPPHEPRYAIDSSRWDRVSCVPFLDAKNSPLLSRLLWLPFNKWSDNNEYGDYCLLREKKRAEKREKKKWV
ncbi:glycosyltransferase family 22 protein [Sphaerobolus stellatus SS14]|nr:glycosyltransferase family 22 protein [Sphaerobolus stellatus SS14]